MKIYIRIHNGHLNEKLVRENEDLRPVTFLIVNLIFSLSKQLF